MDVTIPLIKVQESLSILLAYLLVMAVSWLNNLVKVGGPSAPTQRLSSLFDTLLKPFCSEVKSYVQDDLDFLRHLPEKIEENSKFVTLDVINLYSNISNSLGLEAIKYWVNKNPEKINNRFLKDFILEAVEIVLTNNTFTFNGKHFRQIKGTAMGTKMAPNICDFSPRIFGGNDVQKS